MEGEVGSYVFFFRKEDKVYLGWGVESRDDFGYNCGGN